MSIEQNKKIASEFFDCFNTNDIARALDIMADDAKWWIAGNSEQLPVAGTHSKEQIGRVFYNMASQFKSGLRVTIKGSTAEGDRVALEAESFGELKNGRIYNQHYHFLITIRDEKISEVKEYLDTQHVFAVWFQP